MARIRNLTPPQPFLELGYPRSTRRVAEWDHAAMAVETVLCPLVPNHRRAGRRLTPLSVTLRRPPTEDFVWTWNSECLLTESAVHLFRDEGFNGYELKPVMARVHADV